MKQPKTIIAGSFTIEPAQKDTIDSVGTLLSQSYVDMDATPILPLDMRTLYAGGDQTHPPLFAIALPLPTGAVWVLRGIEDVAQLPIKDKYVKDNKLVRPLVDWAGTFSENAAFGLVTQAYRGMIDVDDSLDDDLTNDDSIHVTIELPLDEIDVHRAPGVDYDEWLDALSDVAEAALDRVDADGEVILFDASDDDRPAIAGHISLSADDDEDAINLVTEAMAEAFAPFTPAEDVRDRLSVEIEEMCLYSMLNGLIDGLDPDDLADFSD